MEPRPMGESLRDEARGEDVLRLRAEPGCSAPCNVRANTGDLKLGWFYVLSEIKRNNRAFIIGLATVFLATTVCALVSQIVDYGPCILLKITELQVGEYDLILLPRMGGFMDNTSTQGSVMVNFPNVTELIPDVDSQDMADNLDDVEKSVKQQLEEQALRDLLGDDVVDQLEENGWLNDTEGLQIVLTAIINGTAIGILSGIIIVYNFIIFMEVPFTLMFPHTQYWILIGSALVTAVGASVLAARSYLNKPIALVLKN